MFTITNKRNKISIKNIIKDYVKVKKEFDESKKACYYYLNYLKDILETKLNGKYSISMEDNKLIIFKEVIISEEFFKKNKIEFKGVEILKGGLVIVYEHRIIGIDLITFD